MRTLVIAVMGLVLAAPVLARDEDGQERALQRYFLDQQTTPSGSTTTRTKPKGTRLAAPKPLKAKTTSNRVSLTWSNINNETGFLIERRLHDTKQFSEIAKTTANVTSYTDILTNIDHYEYRVRAYKAVGGMTYSPYTNTVVSEAPCN